METGAIFCQDRVIYEPILFKDIITEGTQKWIGIAPSLVINLKIIIDIIKIEESINKPAPSIKREPILCTI